MMYDDDFKLRLSKLRTAKGVSAREMSLSIGQNAGYINNIESGKALPKMNSFFFICEYLGITPQEFFDYDSQFPESLRILMDNMKKLDKKQLCIISDLVNELIKK